MNFYEEEVEQNEEIPTLTLGELKPIYNHISKLDGSRGSPFETQLDDEIVIIDDVRLLLEKLAKHYAIDAEIGDFCVDW